MGLFTKSILVLDYSVKQSAHINQVLRAGVRVTVKLADKTTASQRNGKEANSAYQAEIVDASEPSKKLGTYWGYQTRIAGSITSALEDSPFEVGPSGQTCKILARQPGLGLGCPGGPNVFARPTNFSESENLAIHSKFQNLLCNSITKHWSGPEQFITTCSVM